MQNRTEGMNQENVKQRNRSAILKLLCNKGAMSRKDIAEAMGLTPAAVTLICADLIETGVIEEKGEVAQEKKAGRKKILVDINYANKNVLCIAIESDETYISLTDLAGQIIEQKTVVTDKTIVAEDFLKQIADQCQVMIKDSPRPLLGAGVSVPGIVDRGNGISFASYGIWGRDVQVQAILQSFLDCKVVVENNVKAFANGELLYGMGRTVDNLMFIKWGPGVGSAVTINRQIYQGRDFKGAEIGHYIVNRTGKLCRCGRRGCLETEISTHAICESVNEEFVREKMPVLSRWLDKSGSQIEVANLEDWAVVGDAGVDMILDRKIEELALTTENVVSILNPDRVIVYGRLFEIDRVLEKFKTACSSFDPELAEDYIQRSDISHRINYIGPLAVAMSEFHLSGV